MARYAVIRTACHGGGIMGEFDALKDALMAANKWRGRPHRDEYCRCGGCFSVHPITEEARAEYAEHLGVGADVPDHYTGVLLTLASDLPQYSTTLHYSASCI